MIFSLERQIKCFHLFEIMPSFVALPSWASLTPLLINTICKFDYTVFCAYTGHYHTIDFFYFSNIFTAQYRTTKGWAEKL